MLLNRYNFLLGFENENKEDIDKILPPISRFSGGGNRKKKKQSVIEKLKAFFEKYFDIINPSKI